MFEEYKMGSHISVVKNPNYWQKGKPYLDKVIYRIITDAPREGSLPLRRGKSM